MTDRFLTPESLTAGASTAPALVDLRRLERLLEHRIARLDLRVDRLLDLGGPPFREAAAEIDVLCAAMEEAVELLDETRAEIALAVERHQARRSGRRRWN